MKSIQLCLELYLIAKAMPLNFKWLKLVYSRNLDARREAVKSLDGDHPRRGNLAKVKRSMSGLIEIY